MGSPRLRATLHFVSGMLGLGLFGVRRVERHRLADPDHTPRRDRPRRLHAPRPARQRPPAGMWPDPPSVADRFASRGGQRRRRHRAPELLGLVRRRYRFADDDLPLRACQADPLSCQAHHIGVSRIEGIWSGPQRKRSSP